MEKEKRLIDLSSRSPSIREKTGIKFIGVEEKFGGGIRSFADKSALGSRDARTLKRAKTDLGAEVPVSTAPNRYAAPAAIASVAISVNARMVTGPIAPLLILARPTLQPSNAILALITSAVQATTSMLNGDPVLMAGAADALLSNPEVSKASCAARSASRKVQQNWKA
jgi:hypothetical protein